MNVNFTQPDVVVLKNLIQDIRIGRRENAMKPQAEACPELMEKFPNEDGMLDHDKATIQTLKAWNDPKGPDFAPTVFTTWDDGDIPEILNKYLVKPYARLATRIVRHPTDVVFLTHIILYLTVNLSSAIWLFHRFSHLHGIVHTLYTAWCVGSFTLMMHNHIHNNGVLAKRWKWLDVCFPYVLEPLMGHTWDSYYYHHVKHHHVESNGTLCELRNSQACTVMLTQKRCRAGGSLIHDQIPTG